ncbi:MAG: 3-dehydroquinate synthase family protein [Bacteroidota bacterium]
MEDLPLSKPLNVQSVFREYSVEFTYEIESVLRDEVQDGDYFIIDENIARLYPSLCEIVPESKLWKVDAQETSKSYEGVIPLIERLIEHGFRKNHRLFAIGGGITQDVAAFVASMLYRGVEWIFIPTNMLSQCDSCIGSKTSINFRQYKNQLGGFYPPSKIFIDTAFTKTLGDKEIRSGLGEMLHYFAVTSAEDVAQFKIDAPMLLKGEIPIEKMMHRSLEIKRDMIQIDEFDQGPRNVFNYGHSFAHALESAIDYALPHGICVSIGMDLANLVSESLGLITMVQRNSIRGACELVYQGIELPEIDLEKYYLALGKDKKNVGTQLGLIVTEGEGKMYKKLCAFTPELKALIARFFQKNLYKINL